MPSEDAKGLARAVLAGDDAAVLALLDTIQEERMPDAAREWLRLWDECALRAMAALLGTSSDDDYWHQVDEECEQNGTTTTQEVAGDCYNYADSMMRERAKRMRDRANQKPA